MQLECSKVKPIWSVLIRRCQSLSHQLNINLKRRVNRWRLLVVSIDTQTRFLLLRLFVYFIRLSLLLFFAYSLLYTNWMTPEVAVRRCDRGMWDGCRCQCGGKSVACCLGFDFWLSLIQRWWRPHAARRRCRDETAPRFQWNGTAPVEEEEERIATASQGSSLRDEYGLEHAIQIRSIINWSLNASQPPK